jgi:hypothetical protein
MHEDLSSRQPTEHQRGIRSFQSNASRNSEGPARLLVQNGPGTRIAAKFGRAGDWALDPPGRQSADYGRIACQWQRKATFLNIWLTVSDPLKPLFGGLSPGLDALVRKASEARSLTSRVQSELPEPVRPHVLSASRRDNDLVVIVDSAAWSARVRYAGRRLKSQLEAGGEPAIDKVRVKVRGSG